MARRERRERAQIQWDQFHSVSTRWVASCKWDVSYLGPAKMAVVQENVSTSDEYEYLISIG